MLIRESENHPTDDAEAVEVLRTALKGKYESLSRFHPMPWLPHQLPLTNVFTKLQLISPGSQQDPLLLDRDQLLTLDNLFAPHELSKDPKRILVEGEAGIGKTTLLQMLVSKWNKGTCGEECGSPCVHCFDLLFNLHAKDFIGHTSIPDVIKSCLLARDSEIPTETLDAILQTHKVVLVVDAYDEGCMENHLLNDVIEGRVLKDATVLLSCRPAFQKFRFFDSIFVVYGFDEEHKIEYVDRFAHEMNLSPNSLVELQQKMSNELQDLCRNPFILTILCMLCSENSPQLPSTRADIYKAVHEFFIENASRKTGRDKDDIRRNVISPLAKVSFEIYNKEKHLTEEDFDDLCCSPEEACQIGYLSVDETIGSLKNATRCYRFGHQSLQNYLATIHLGKMAAGERLAWLQSKNFYRIDTIVIFLFGQLNDEDLASTAAVITQDIRFQPLNLSRLFFYSCSQSHLVLHCLNELAGRDISDGLKSVLAENCPLRIHISRDCSISCIQGVSMICSLIKKKHSVCLTFDLDATKDFIPLMKQLKRCECISYVQLNYPQDRIKFNDYLRALQRMISAIRHLHCLESINIKMTPLNDEILEVLSSVLSELKYIKWVTLAKIGSDHHPSRLQNLFRAIASCKRITALTFADMHIDDALMPSICEMVESLEDLQDLTLWKNTFSANALEDLSVTLGRRPNKLNMLDIKDNEGSKNERVVKLLQRNCRSVIHD
ncbi:hypothetical protein CAPTEDRAFT_193316 [Capitella teleta]|uniref:NACHT domain-containing protein n=1 Tax=Capitella teleta TaxID=283909 RepID=R7UV57_CAPTE|nr:hypothetical protein CAPTEDRAFT_193316 [Capitella teleta]|eukprot:ELU10023.1 hypothetical protein CAPTEDRAFT_193316 [Capitella teleta]